MRAAAEMKKQAAQSQGTGKGMMSVVLPMYAVGIVIYLIYTMTKVRIDTLDISLFIITTILNRFLARKTRRMKAETT
jgi:hypothetical protein